MKTYVANLSLGLGGEVLRAGRGKEEDVLNFIWQNIAKGGTLQEGRWWFTDCVRPSGALPRARDARGICGKHGGDTRRAHPICLTNTDGGALRQARCVRLVPRTGLPHQRSR
jgi:hypothetical protein